MRKLNVEIKARCRDLAAARKVLQQHDPRIVGVDQQKDTYFVIPKGRLKLREGNVENALIYYEREDLAGPKASRVHMVTGTRGSGIGHLLEAALGTKVVVEKRREILFIDNVKFHLDEVPGLGQFLEIEAIAEVASTPAAADDAREVERLRSQVVGYMAELGVRQEDLITKSYSDLLLEMQGI